MVNEPLVSIIIDNYNYEKYIAASIESALNQTYANIEVIVVDDGSTDSSWQIISSYGSGIKKVHKNNGGQASAFNAGFEASSGEIIFFLDSDDLLFNHAVQTVVKLFLSSQITKVHWPLEIISSDGKPSGAYKPTKFLPEGDLSDEVFNGGPTSYISSPTSGNAWSGNFLKKIFPVPENVDYYKTCADEYLYTLAPLFGEIRAVKEPLGYYRIHDKSIYSSLSFDDKLNLELKGHGQQVEALSLVLNKNGIIVDKEKWYNNSWFHKLAASIRDVQSGISANSKIIIADNGVFPLNEMFPNYQIANFIDSEGSYNGAPIDDDHAIEELNRLRSEGYECLIFMWPGFWYLENYKGFNDYLKNHFPKNIETECVIGFALSDEMTQSNPLVSIIVNNYNYGRFLNDSIGSALNQTYKNIEVIVVDDGSTDNSKEIIESFHGRIKTVFKTNGGQGSAYNSGFNASLGEYVCMLDADDTLVPQAIDTAVKSFINNSVVKVQWPFMIVDNEGNPTGEISTKSTPLEGNLEPMVLESGPYYDFYITTGCLLTKQFLRKVFPMPEPEYRNGADVYLITLAPLFGNIRNIKTPLGTYRIHGKNNYAGKKLDEATLRNYIRRFESNCAALYKFAKAKGLRPDLDLWKKSNFNYLWPKRLLEAKKDIESLIPEKSQFILIDGNEWGDTGLVEKRFAHPFLEKNGIYDGAPDDDETAIASLNTMMNKGIRFVVIWWTSFWWLEHYKNFADYLKSRSTCLLQNDSIIVYELKPFLV